MRTEMIRQGWNNFFFKGFSGDSLGLLRIYFGCGLLLYHIAQLHRLLILDPHGAQFTFLEPIWYFQLLGVDYHIPVLSFVAFVVLMVANIMMILGKWTRTSLVIIILCIFYLKGARDSFTGDVHHRYLLPIHILFLLLLSKCGEARSLDKRHRGTSKGIQEWEASWPIKAMQVYCAFFYFFAIVAKFRVAGWEWFAGDGRIQELLVRRSAMWGVTDTGDAVGNQLAFWLAQHPDYVFLLAVLVIVFETIFPVILFIKDVRWRLMFLLGVAFFHISNLVLIYVNFILLPIVFLIFFDLVPVHARLKRIFSRDRDSPRPTAFKNTGQTP